MGDPLDCLQKIPSDTVMWLEAADKLVKKMNAQQSSWSNGFNTNKECQMTRDKTAGRCSESEGKGGARGGGGGKEGPGKRALGARGGGGAGGGGGWEE